MRFRLRILLLWLTLVAALCGALKPRFDARQQRAAAQIVSRSATIQWARLPSSSDAPWWDRLLTRVGLPRPICIESISLWQSPRILDDEFLEALQRLPEIPHITVWYDWPLDEEAVRALQRAQPACWIELQCTRMGQFQLDIF